MTTCSVRLVARLPHQPIIVEGPQNRTAYVGETVRFSCRLLSDPEYHLQWVKHYEVNGSYSKDDGTFYINVIQVTDSPVPHLASSLPPSLLIYFLLPHSVH